VPALCRDELPYDDKTALLSLIHGLGERATPACDGRVEHDVELLHAIASDGVENPLRHEIGAAAIDALGRHTERTPNAVQALIEVLVSAGTGSLASRAHRQLESWRARDPDARTVRLLLALDELCWSSDA
jgi:hypothetical protein